MTFGDLDDPASEVRRRLGSRPSHALQEAAGTEPRIFYLT
jgi:Fe-S-cluster-containing dehydrogenase component